MTTSFLSLQEIFDTFTPDNWKELAGILYTEKVPMTIVAEQVLKLYESKLLIDPAQKRELFRSTIYLLGSKTSQLLTDERIVVEDPNSPTILNSNCFLRTELLLFMKCIPKTHCSGKGWFPTDREVAINEKNQFYVKKYSELPYFEVPTETLSILWDLRDNDSIMKKTIKPSYLAAYESVVKKLCDLFEIKTPSKSKIKSWSKIHLQLHARQKKFELQDPNTAVQMHKLIEFDSTNTIQPITEDKLKQLGIISC